MTDPRLRAAIVDRFTFGGTIIETGTDSYPMAQTRTGNEQTTVGRVPIREFSMEGGATVPPSTRALAQWKSKGRGGSLQPLMRPVHPCAGRRPRLVRAGRGVFGPAPAPPGWNHRNGM